VEKYGGAGQATGDNIMWRLRIACWIPEATDIHSEYVILIALPRQYMLHERASMLLYRVLPFLFLECAVIKNQLVVLSLHRN
jgi:hypothetical protein